MIFCVLGGWFRALLVCCLGLAGFGLAGVCLVGLVGVVVAVGWFWVGFDFRWVGFGFVGGVGSS